jgi:hypothetical protein
LRTKLIPLFLTGQNRNIYHTIFQTDQGWSQPRNLGSWAVGTQLTAVLLADSQVDLFHVGLDSHIYSRRYKNGKWALDWEKVSEEITMSRVSAVYLTGKTGEKA